MEHENRKKRRQNRRLFIMGIIIPLLVLVAIGIIFYAFGWRFDLNNRKLYVSSVLYFRSQPLGADIYLNEKLQGSTKLIQRQAKPGVYNLKLLKPGFMPWEAILDVPDSSVVEVDPYLFYTQPKLLKSIAFDKLLAVFKQKVAFIKDNQINYCDLPCDKFQNLNLTDLSFTKSYLGDQKIYLEYPNYYLSINLSSQKQEKLNKLTELTTKQIVFNNNGAYILTDNNNLYQLTTAAPLLIQEQIKNITGDKDWLYFITKNGELSAKQDQVKNITTGKIVAKNSSQDNLNINDLSLTTFPNDSVFLIQDKNYFLLNNNQAEFVGANLQNYITIDGYSAWLTTTGDLYLRTPDNNTPRFVNNYFNNPKDIFFFSPEYIALVYDNQLKMIETTTKQEFVLFNYKETNNYLFPSTETGISQIANNKIINYQITDSISFWQKILTIFHR